MTIPKAVYITCTRRKSRQRKHIDVCRRCEWNKTCKPYQEYIKSQPMAEKPAGLPHGLLLSVKEELEEIRTILKKFAGDDRKAVPAKPQKTFQKGMLWEAVIKDLKEIQSVVRKVSIHEESSMQR